MSAHILCDNDNEAHRPTLPTAEKSLLRSRRTAGRGAMLIVGNLNATKQMIELGVTSNAISKYRWE
jgi:hypothetical protein